VIIPLPKDTEAVLGKDAVLGENRSWLLTRSLAWETSVSALAALVERAASLKPNPVYGENWQRFVALDLGVPPEQVLFARLKSRLLMGGVPLLRSAALPQVDRLSGLPQIPGSVVKGCARHAALDELREASSPSAKAEVLEQFALVFGWKSSDWWNGVQAPELEAAKQGRRGFLAQACGPEASPILEEARRRVWSRLEPGEAYAEASWWRRFGEFGGAVQFLAALPWQSKVPELELEVAVNHHTGYYSGHSGYERAPDVEPLSVRPFLAIARDQVFAFVLLGEPSLDRVAQRWLAQGLALSGLGARKSSGYGWFETSSEWQQTYRADLKAMQDRCRLERERVEAELREQQRQAAAQKAAQARAERMQSLTDEELLVEDLMQLKDVQFWGKLQKFHSLDEDTRKAMVQVLQNQRAEFWEELKRRASRGGQWGRVEHQIRQFSRENELGKMP
jgi:CRISPR-associated protein Cmr6